MSHQLWLISYESDCHSVQIYTQSVREATCMVFRTPTYFKWQKRCYVIITSCFWSWNTNLKKYRCVRALVAWPIFYVLFVNLSCRIKHLWLFITVKIKCHSFSQVRHEPDCNDVISQRNFSLVSFLHPTLYFGRPVTFSFSARSPDTYSMNEEFDDDYDDMDDMGTPPLSDRRRRSAPELPQFHWTLEKVGF